MSKADASEADLDILEHQLATADEIASGEGAIDVRNDGVIDIAELAQTIRKKADSSK